MKKLTADTIDDEEIGKLRAGLQRAAMAGDFNAPKDIAVCNTALDESAMAEERREARGRCAFIINGQTPIMVAVK